MTVIDGELAEPDPPVWACPRCTRRVHGGERRAISVTCAADPITGRPHPPTPMTDLSQPMRRMICP